MNQNIGEKESKMINHLNIQDIDKRILIKIIIIIINQIKIINYN